MGLILAPTRAPLGAGGPEPALLHDLHGGRALGLIASGHVGSLVFDRALVEVLCFVLRVHRNRLELLELRAQ